MSDDPFDIPDAPGSSGRSQGAGGSGPARGRRWPWLLAGVALGVAATFLVPRYVAPHLPAPFRAGELQVRGVVLAEQQEEDRLLLTVETDQGAVLATFRRQVSEIGLLVDVGDTVTLGIREYRPFVQDPTLMGVYKGRPPADAGAADTSGEGYIRPDTMSQTPTPESFPDTADAGERPDGGASEETPVPDTARP